MIITPLQGLHYNIRTPQMTGTLKFDKFANLHLTKLGDMNPIAQPPRNALRPKLGR